MSKPGNVFEHLREIRPRLPLYIGDRDIARLQHYLSGYGAALRAHGIEEVGVPRFYQFGAWLSLKRKRFWTCGWAHGLLAESADEPEALDKFFELAEEFGRLVPTPGKRFEMGPGVGRSEKYREYNPALGSRRMPSLLEVMRLDPGDFWYLRSWYGEEAEDSARLHSSEAGVFHQVNWEYGIEAGEWIEPIRG